MAGLFGGGQANAYTQPKYTGLNIQTSARGLPIPVMWGQQRCGCNLIQYGNFQDNGDKGGKGGAKGQANYTCYLILLICEGPITNIPFIWVDASTATLGSQNLGYATGTADQEPPTWMTDLYPEAARSYAYTAYAASELFQLGSSPVPPNMNFEVYGKFRTSMTAYGSLSDCCMGDIIPDMILSEQYGLDPGATYIDAPSLAAYKTYGIAQGLFFSPYCNQQEQGKSILQRWAQLTNSWICWTGTSLKFIPLVGSTITNTVDNSIQYIPNINPLFDFGLDDYECAKGDIPVTVTRSDPRDAYNRVEVDILDRPGHYNVDPILWEDPASIAKYGLLQSQIISANEICEKDIGATVAALIGIRAANLRNTYSWKTRNQVCMVLEPGDLLTLTEPNILLNRFPVRIQTLSRDAQGIFTLVAEAFPEGQGQVTTYAQQSNGGTTSFPNPYTDPGSINPPLLLEPPLTITGGVPQIWVGASGGPNWGGGLVYISPDNTNFAEIGTIDKKTIQGTLTSNLGTSTDPDTVDTLALDTGESDTNIPTAVTQAMADAFQTASLIDDEILAYGTVSITGTSTYDLTYLRRGGYDTLQAAHSAGAQWWQINPNACVQFPLPEAYVGETLYFKVCSYNLFGNSQQDLSEATTYTYTVQGNAYYIGPPTDQTLAVVNYLSSGTLAMQAAWDTSTGPDLGGYDVAFSTDHGATWPFNQQVGASATQAYLLNPIPSTDYVARIRAYSANGLAESNWVTTGIVNSGASPVVPPSAPGSFTVTQVGTHPYLSWTPNTDTTVTDQILRRVENGGSTISLLTSVPLGTSTLLDTGASGISNSFTYWLNYVNAAGAGPSSSGSVTLTSTINTLTLGGDRVTYGGNPIVLN